MYHFPGNAGAAISIAARNRREATRTSWTPSISVPSSATGTAAKTVCQRSAMSEMALYTVRDGKIVREQFFYNASEAEA